MFDEIEPEQTRNPNTRRQRTKGFYGLGKRSTLASVGTTTTMRVTPDLRTVTFSMVPMRPHEPVWRQLGCARGSVTRPGLWYGVTIIA